MTTTTGATAGPSHPTGNRPPRWPFTRLTRTGRPRPDGAGDVMASQAVLQVEPGHIRVGDTYAATFAVTGYPVTANVAA